MERISYARVCVEVKADAPLPAQLRVQIVSSAKLPDQLFTDIQIDYQWKPKRCSPGNRSEAQSKTAPIFRPNGRILADSLSLLVVRSMRKDLLS
ncbi:hypothetical protein Nepgr_030113 [Nepenthes gracilis]|uniref:Uncharacterized protein n=1 Tax=Nepenthes gracilis TaxID=150966 RepID=A0AAD3TES9_NEPGR|nr:hypothetical protein Nepgr_030113 [Nepenthes gracilis]